MIHLLPGKSGAAKCHIGNYSITKNREERDIRSNMYVEIGLLKMSIQQCKIVIFMRVYSVKSRKYEFMCIKQRLHLKEKNEQ